jgi:hypothetical protein
LLTGTGCNIYWQILSFASLLFTFVLPTVVTLSTFMLSFTFTLKSISATHATGYALLTLFWLMMGFRLEIFLSVLPFAIVMCSASIQRLTQSSEFIRSISVL